MRALGLLLLLLATFLPAQVEAGTDYYYDGLITSINGNPVAPGTNVTLSLDCRRRDTWASGDYLMVWNQDPQGNLAAQAGLLGQFNNTQTASLNVGALYSSTSYWIGCFDNWPPFYDDDVTWGAALIQVSGGDPPPPGGACGGAPAAEAVWSGGYLLPPNSVRYFNYGSYNCLVNNSSLWVFFPQSGGELNYFYAYMPSGVYPY